jgi:hypothetical protein
MAIDKKLIDELLTNHKKPEDIIGEKGLLKELIKAILERALGAEMTEHLSYEARPGGPPPGKHAQRQEPKDLEGQLWRDETGDAARSASDIRAPDRWARDRRAGRASTTRLSRCMRGG